jgi:uncharacterized membrane protein
MLPIVSALILGLTSTALFMCAAGLAAGAIALSAIRHDLIEARGIDKVAALAVVCFAASLAIFGAEHFSLPQAIAAGVPPYMPWRMFWVYFIGFALIAAALSIAVKRQVRWSGLLFGVMMSLFVAMLHLPLAVKAGGRIPWTIVLRELSFGGGGLVLSGIAMGRKADGAGRNLIMSGRTLIAITLIFFGVQHFLHPLGLPGVPLEKQMPPWVPVRPVIDYVTGAFLLIAGVSFLLARSTRIASAYLGAWILLVLALIYVPVLIGALANPNLGLQVEGINYFADTLLFAGVILSVADTDGSRPARPSLT